ncbi:type I restriction endonuclease subunit R [uncultured Fusobacterium sp.]|uniref:type I restriction endonuclease subunit R n=1 Tax=uncultured Fusobacterium sp. TaxID=159267 RepID=UPI0015A67894|nr:HsdR family type I site-specific deoxyribonuclease [uncultured Fusobacterium sp.]
MSNKQKNYFNEATRVQMPALVHLTRLGYKYIGKISEEQANVFYQPETNILIDEFKNQFTKLNPEYNGNVEEILENIKQELNNNDLGKQFYKRLTSESPTKLIDFKNIENNSFYCTAEFTCKNENEEFRPDITLFINGLPLVFIEVKRPNNQGGIIAESNRMNDKRFPNKKFRRFINITQLMMFSNNMEYDTMGGIVPIQGAFYCTASKKKAFFNCFREDIKGNVQIADFIKNYPYKEIDKDLERKILSDFNNQVIHTAPEYQTNLNINTPTNRIITSMCSKERILYLLKYGIAYVNMEREVDGKIEIIDEKHIMRYQQLFASFAIKDKIDKGVKSGIIWHTQGSGKTALSYYLTNVLTDYFASKNQVAKFYFIVDRLDLLEQAGQEFKARGLKVKTANSRAELMQQFRENKSLEGNSGENEITVVNIQRFEEDKEKVEIPPYATNLQRIFIIDEAHRGYNPKGSFLANLLEADKNAIKIALTGTPLLKEERTSWKVFGDYIHTYYYDKSIQDGYTLKIIREDIETSYKEKLSEIYDKLDILIQKKDIKKNQIIEHENYVKELLRYIISDLNKFRMIQGDKTLGGMVICETSEQARKLFTYFDEIQKELNDSSSIKSNLKAGLILHDSDDKETRKQIVKDFKKNMTIDILIVFNMLLTGFDAPRLKRLYFGRKLKDHNLLQAITRVNRPYKDNRYGYIIDFADIKKNFEETNEAYIKELNRFNNTEEIGEDTLPDLFTHVIEDKEYLITQMKKAKQVLFNYTTNNLEEFSSEISTIEDKEVLLELKKVLTEARDCCNLVRTFGDDELKETFKRIEILKLPQMLSEVQRHINLINQKELFNDNQEIKAVINEAMNEITFSFKKVSEEEMKLISGGVELDEKWKKTISSFTENIDKEDPEYITLQEAFMKKFKEKGFVIDSVEEFYKKSKELDEVIKKLEELKKKNRVLMNKYRGDKKFARVHKRISEENRKRENENKTPIISTYDEDIMNMLNGIKDDVDRKVYDRNDILKKDAYFSQTVMTEISKSIKELGFQSDREDRDFIKNRIVKEYMSQYRETYFV